MLRLQVYSTLAYISTYAEAIKISNRTIEENSTNFQQKYDTILAQNIHQQQFDPLPILIAETENHKSKDKKKAIVVQSDSDDEKTEAQKKADEERLEKRKQDEKFNSDGDEVIDEKKEEKLQNKDEFREKPMNKFNDPNLRELCLDMQKQEDNDPVKSMMKMGANFKQGIVEIKRQKKLDAEDANDMDIGNQKHSYVPKF